MKTTCKKCEADIFYEHGAWSACEDGGGGCEHDPILPDFRLIALDETRGWHLPEHEGTYERIETVYLYDANRPVHLCEITPSYELFPLYCHAVGESVPEELEELMLSDIDAYDPTYMHCSAVDRMVKILCNPIGDDYEDDYETIQERYEEHYRCNPIL